MAAITHGMSQSLAYKHWQNLTRRLKKHKDVNFKELFKESRVNNQIDPDWWEARNFLDDMGECPEGMSLFRYNSTLPWSKDNCQWALKGATHRNLLRKLDIRMVTHRRLTKANCG